MDLPDVVRLLEALDSLSVDHWIDGGWGVDCLLGEQTRPHSDLDVVVSRETLDRVRRYLLGQGFEVIRDWLPTTLALRHADGREVDLHPVDPTPDGGGDQVLEDGSAWHYGRPVRGSLGGRVARCASAAEQLAMHEGYQPRLVDREDVRRLVERFDLPWPVGYAAGC